jgi:exodeoxyribonuclease V beta subunit
MAAELTVFDSARVHLTKGIHLVEASAGTGKTYAIAMLVLRAVAELDIPIEKVLIVTFTKAATEELRSRIRARLVQARDFLTGNLQISDETMENWTHTIVDAEKCVERLQLALYDIDRAGIFTIHSFCQRMLQEQALESGQLFDIELIADIKSITTEIVRDFWRIKLYPLDPLACQIVGTHFQFPDDLYKTVYGVNSDSTIEPEQQGLDELLSDLKQMYNDLAIWLTENFEVLAVTFQENKDFFKKDFKEKLDQWLQEVFTFFSDPNSIYPQNLEWLSQKGLYTVLNGNKLRGKAKKEEFLKKFVFPEKEILGFLKASSELVLEFRLVLVNYLQTETAKRLEKLGGMSFDDLIRNLSKALSQESGENLKNILGQRFHMALIDEFQDTDARQWHIFSTVFGGGEHFLYLIGDPKQAIYRFRGADIHSYFQARDRAWSLLTLEKNYRTHPYLVEEVNNLFLSRTHPFGFEGMEYQSVLPAKSDTDCYLKRASGNLANMVYCQLPPNESDKGGRWTSGKASQRFMEFVVVEICGLLRADDPVVLVKDGEERLLKPEDIAILVRTNRQAEEYVDALASQGVPAVLASKESVFQSKECRELLQVLRAIASPGDMGTLKSAMALSWLGLSGDELVLIWQDEDLFEGWHSRFQQYHELWLENGFLMMMNSFLKGEGILATLAREVRAERKISNLHHLMELVQEAETASRLGVNQTLQWLQLMADGQEGIESGELRLESDQAAVKIMTMHGAKGLEFPVVFCPFLWYRSIRLLNEKQFLECQDGKPVTDLGSEDFERRKLIALEEELAEDLRLLYVAVTRAVVRCYIMWADIRPLGVRDSFSSALGYLLFTQEQSYDQQSEVLKQRAKNPAVYYLRLSDSELSVARYLGQQLYGKNDLRSLKRAGRMLQSDWQMSSYSAMAALGEVEHHHMRSPGEVTVGQTRIPVTNLPMGASFGSLIHDCCELRPFMDLSSEYNRPLWREKCRRYGVEVELDSLGALLENIVKTPLRVNKEKSLDENQFKLEDIPERTCLKEMEFYFHLDPITTENINTLLQGEPTVTPLSYRKMQGFLTGFVDLICEYNGKFYIIDYKTNYLGENLEDYAPDKLVGAMAAHNYGLQYWIYTLVVHRHLKNILPGYRYEEHFGGVMYLFVRGMIPHISGSGVFYTRPCPQLLEDLVLCFEGEG